MLATEFRPLRELVLTARRVKLFADSEELRLRLLLFGEVLRGLRRQGQVEVP